MKKLFVLWTAACILLVCSAAQVSAAGRTVSYRNAKTIGMGNTRIAGGFGYNGFVDNPALLSRVKIVRFSIVNLPITLNKNTLDIGNFIADETISDFILKYLPDILS